MSCLVTPAGGPSSPVDLLPDVAPGGKLGQQSPGVVDLVPDSVLGVISSGIRCTRTFCEHLTALYAVECSKNTQEVLREGTGRPPRGKTSGYADELVPPFARQAAREPAHEGARARLTARFGTPLQKSRTLFKRYPATAHGLGRSADPCSMCQGQQPRTAQFPGPRAGTTASRESTSAPPRGQGTRRRISPIRHSDPCPPASEHQ
jgi:hypothetical protein